MNSIISCDHKCVLNYLYIKCDILNVYVLYNFPFVLLCLFSQFFFLNFIYFNIEYFIYSKSIGKSVCPCYLIGYHTK